MTLQTANGMVRTRLGNAQHPDAVLSGTPQLVVAVLTGKLGLADARAAGLKYEGDPEILRRVQPKNPQEPHHTKSADNEGK